MYRFIKNESGEFLKYLDKLLKILKTDRNTFFTYLLTMVSVYILIDRLIELLLLCFTGISVSYWGPIKYTLAMACPVFAFLFSGSSKYSNSKNVKLTFVYTYVITLYVIGISMITQWLNQLAWLLLLSVPNYVEIATQFSDLIKPAFTALALYIPLTTFFPLIKFIALKVDDTKELKDSIFDYGGIDLSNKSEGSGPYMCEVAICTDNTTGKPVTVPETKRFDSMLVAGVSGSGKTSMVFEPMIARDLEKKYFFHEVSKELGFTALKTGIAYLKKPYNNDYLNKHFNLNMLSPVDGKEKLYKAFMKKMIYSDTASEGIKYRNIGLTAMSPDYESTSHMIEVAENFNIPIHIIDPSDPNSPGLNPFIFEDPTKIAIAISSVLKGMYFTSNTDVEQAFRENVAAQAIENLTVILKVMYPKINSGRLPNLEDMLKMLNNFDLVEKMCRILETDEELAEKYELQLGYFKKNFYKDGPGRTETEKFIYAAVSQLDSLLRIEGIRNILCNRTNNINYDQVLENGEVTFVCTRRGDLGATAHKAFGLFFILLMQYSVLRRGGIESTRIPHFMYIDEFSPFIGSATGSMFTLYRKYKVGLIVSVQNLDQLGNKNTSKYRQTILSNCSTKMVFGNNTPEDNDWWAWEFGDKREWKYQRDYDVREDSEHEKGYTPTYKSIEWAWTKRFSAGKVQSLKFKSCIYKTKNIKGKTIVDDGKVDFLESKYKELHSSKSYNFSRFTAGISKEQGEDKKEKKRKFDPKSIEFKGDHDVDPIQTDNTDSNFLLNNDDAIIFDLKKGNPNG